MDTLSIEESKEKSTITESGGVKSMNSKLFVNHATFQPNYKIPRGLKFFFVLITLLVVIAVVFSYKKLSSWDTFNFPANEHSLLDQLLERVDEKKIRSAVKFLSDDLLEGRQMGSRGEKLAANYIAHIFDLGELEPGFIDSKGNASYFQEIEATG